MLSEDSAPQFFLQLCGSLLGNTEQLETSEDRKVLRFELSALSRKGGRNEVMGKALALELDMGLNFTSVTYPGQVFNVSKCSFLSLFLSPNTYLFGCIRP